MKKKLKLPHVPYVARKIAIDLLNSGYIKFSAGIEGVVKIADEIMREDLLKERAFDEKANEILDSNEGDIEVMQIDKRNMFWLIKRKLADEAGFMLDYEDRYSTISHQILESAWKQNLIDYQISENRVKNMIYTSIGEYLKQYELLEDIVIDKIDAMSKRPIAGTDEYDLLFEKLYEEELKKRGMF